MYICFDDCHVRYCREETLNLYKLRCLKKINIYIYSVKYLDKIPHRQKLSVNQVKIKGIFFFHIAFAENHLEIEESFSVKNCDLQLKFMKGMALEKCF